jgi:hypothetical protein
MTLVVSKGISPGNVSDAGVTDDDITIGQYPHPVDNDTLHNHNISKFQQVS